MIKLAKISLVVLTTFMMGMSSANFAMAQEKSLVLEDLSAAQVSPQACAAFRDKVVDVTGKSFKAHWFKVKIGGVPLIPGIPYRVFADSIEGCRVVPAHAADSPYEGDENVRIGNSNASFQSGKNLEAALRKNKTLTEDDITLAKVTAEQEKNESSDFSKAIGWFITLIFSLISAVLGFIASFAGKLMVAVIDLTISGIMPNIVEVGWAIIRDFANMFFILVMIVIGLAAILRLEQYDYRHLLGEVILMAILVNFSKVIAETIFNFSNFLVALFAVDSWWEIMSFLLQVSIGGLDEGVTAGWTVAFIQGLTKMAFMVVTCGTFIILAGMFTVRLVGIYVLIILSPMAYILDILPVTKDMAHKWWHTFIHYVVWAPVAMFMLRLCMLIVQDGGLAVISSQEGSPMLGLTNDSIFNYVVLIGFMIAAIIVAEHAGMVGGKAIVHGVEHAGHWLGHVAHGAAARRWNDYTAHKYSDAEAKAKASGTEVGVGAKLRYLVSNPVAGYKAWSERAHEKDHIASSYAEATAKEIFAGKSGTPYRAFLARKEEVEFSKEYSMMSREGRLEAAKNIYGVKGHEAAVRRRALLRAAAEHNEVEDMALDFIARNHEITDHHGHVQPAEQRYVNAAGEFTNFEMGQFVRDFSESSHDAESRRFIREDWANIGKKERRFDYVGHSDQDPHTPQEKAEQIRKQEAEQKGNFEKLDGQIRAQVSPQNYTVVQIERNAQGQVVRQPNGEINAKMVFNTASPVGAEMFGLFDQAARDQIARVQGRLKNTLILGTADGVVSRPNPQNPQGPPIGETGTIRVTTQDEFNRVNALFGANLPSAKAFAAAKLNINKPSDWAGKNNNEVIIELVNPAGTVAQASRWV